jgi:hypothetical protein
LCGEPTFKISNDNFYKNLGSIQQQVESHTLVVSEKYKKTLYELFECSNTFKNSLELFEQHAALGVVLDKKFPNIDEILESITKKNNNNCNLDNKYNTINFKNNDYVE